MEQTLKQRLVGAAVIIAVGVIVIPMILDGAGERQLRKMPDAPKARIHAKPGMIAEESVPVSSVGETGQIVLTLPEDVATKAIKNTPALNHKIEPEPETQPVAPPKVEEPVKSSTESKPSSQKKPVPPPPEKTASKTTAVKVVKEKVATKAVKEKVTVKVEEKSIQSALPTAVWVVQVGSFTDGKKAFKYRDDLRAKKHKAFVEKISGRSGQSLYRVRIGPMPKREQADNMAAKLKQQGIKGFVTRHP